jgi:hypothetical protein
LTDFLEEKKTFLDSLSISKRGNIPQKIKKNIDKIFFMENEKNQEKINDFYLSLSNGGNERKELIISRNTKRNKHIKSPLLFVNFQVQFF